MDTIWTYDENGCEKKKVEFTYFASVYSGKMKIVLIEPDGSLTTIAEITPETEMEDPQTYAIEIKEGLNRIKIVGGKNTKFDIELSASKGKFNELG